LQHHAPPTSRQPWLRLADPFWQDRKWCNSAFSIAAYRGDATLLSVLWVWAKNHGLVNKALLLKDKKRRNLIEILEDRRRSLGPHHAASFGAAYNVIALDFGKQPSHTVREGHQWRAPALIVDEPTSLGEQRSERVSLDLPSEELSVHDLLRFCSQLALRGKEVLILRLRLVPNQQEDQDNRDVQALIRMLISCKRVCFMHCSAPPELSVLFVRTATAAILSGEENWTSLGVLPQWCVPSGEDFSEDHRASLADALEGFLAAVKQVCDKTLISGFDLPKGIGGYLPADRQHLPLVIHGAFSMKRVAHILASNSKETIDLRQKLQKDFTAYNPLLLLAATLERKLLRRGVLLQCGTLMEAMDPAWERFLSHSSSCWLHIWPACTVGHPQVATAKWMWRCCAKWLMRHCSTSSRCGLPDTVGGLMLLTSSSKSCGIGISGNWHQQQQTMHVSMASEAMGMSCDVELLHAGSGCAPCCSRWQCMLLSLGSNAAAMVLAEFHA